MRAKFDDSIRKGETTKVTGKVLRGDAPVKSAKIRIVWISNKGKIKELGVTRTNSKGRYTIKVAPTRSGTLKIAATSSGQKDVIERPITVKR